MRDTAELGTMTKHAAENYLPQPSRAHMVRVQDVGFQIRNLKGAATCLF